MIEGDRPPEALGEFTGFLMTWVALRGRDRFAAALADLDLRPPHFGAMAVIAAEPGQTQQALVAATGIDASTMVARLDELEAAGLAERRVHPTDRRKRTVYLTDAGEAAVAQVREVAQRVGDETFGALTAAERRQLHGMLRRMAGLD